LCFCFTMDVMGPSRVTLRDLQCTVFTILESSSITEIFNILDSELEAK